MGASANAEGVISLKVELENFKNIAKNITSGLSAELKEVPVDITFDDKKMNAEARKALENINKTLSRGMKSINFGEILPQFISQISNDSLSDEIRLQVIKGLESGLSNFKQHGVKELNGLFDFSALSGKEVKALFEDINNVVDVVNGIPGLNKRQRNAMIKSFRPNSMPTMGNEGRLYTENYTKGAKQLNGILKLKDSYSDVLQYAVDEKEAMDAIKEIFRNPVLTKSQAKESLGYISRLEYLLKQNKGISDNAKKQALEGLKTQYLPEIKYTLGDEANKTISQMRERTSNYFSSLDQLYKSSRDPINYMDIVSDMVNTTNQKLQAMFNAKVSKMPEAEDLVKVTNQEKITSRNGKKTTKQADSADYHDGGVVDYQEEIDRLNSEHDDLDKKYDELSDKATKLRQEISQEKQKLKELDVQVEKEEKADTTKQPNIKKLGKLSNQKQQLENENKELDSAIEDLKRQKQELINKMSALEKEQRALKSAPDEKRESEILDEKVDLAEKYQQIIKDVSDKEGKITSNNLKLKKIQAGLKDLQSQEESGEGSNLQQLKKQRDDQNKLLNEKEQANKELLDQIDKIDDQMSEIDDRIQELEQKQEKINKQREDLRKQQEKSQQKEPESTQKQTTTAMKEVLGAVENVEQDSASGAATGVSSEELQKIIDLLRQIRAGLGSVDDDSDMPNVLTSINNITSALNELKTALDTISAKDFNLNIGLPNQNPIAAQGDAKRKILKEFQKQYDELNDYFVNQYGSDSEAFNALSRREGGSSYLQSMMSDYSVATDTNESLGNRIEAYKTIIEQLRKFVIQEGKELNSVISNTLSPDEIINSINDNVSKANPTEAITSIFKDMKASIDASVVQIANESNGFDFLKGSAEEAAEAKRKFVEANKDVLQSIVASMPKLEEEADALKKVEDVQNKSGNDGANTGASKGKRKGYSDFESMPNDLIEQRFSEISPFPIIARGVSLATNSLNEEYDSSLDLLEQALREEAERTEKEQQSRVYELGRSFQQEQQRQQQRNTQKRIQTELEQSKSADDIKVRTDKEERVAKSLEVQKRVSALLEQEAQVQAEEQRKRVEQSKKQTQAELEQAKYREQALQVSEDRQKRLQEEISEYEKQFHDWSYGEDGGQLTFLDKNDHDLTNEYAQSVKEEIERAKKIAEEEAKNNPVNIPIEGQISFSNNEDIGKIKQAIDVGNSRKELEKQYARLSKSNDYIFNETNIEKFLEPFGDLQSTKSTDELIDISEKIKNIKAELKSSFDSEGKMLGSTDVQRVKDLLTEYDNLTKRIKELKAEISSPISEENAALKIANDLKKAEAESERAAKKVQSDFEKIKETIQKEVQTGKFEKVATQARGALDKYTYYDSEGNVAGDNVEQIKQLNAELDNYRTITEKLKGAKTDQEFVKLGQEAEEAKEKIKGMVDELKNTSSPVATKNQTMSLAKQISSFMTKNYRISNEARAELQKYFDLLTSGSSVGSDALTQIAQRFKEINIVEEQAGRLGEDIFGQMVGKMREGIAYLATKVSAYEIFNQFKQGMEIVHEFDDALTEMMKVSEESRQSLEAYQRTTFDTADAIGTSALQLQQSTADWMRLGEGMSEAAKSAKASNVLMNVSEFQSIDDATTSLVAMSAAYSDLSKMQIVDKLNEVGNNYSISTSGAAEALQASASALKTAGNDMDEALALVTAGNQIVQDVSKAGNGLRTIALRLTGKHSART